MGISCEPLKIVVKIKRSTTMKYLMSISILVCLIAGSQAKISALDGLADSERWAQKWSDSVNQYHSLITSSKKDDIMIITDGVELLIARADASSEDYLNRLWDIAIDFTGVGATGGSELKINRKLADFLSFGFKAMGVGKTRADDFVYDYVGLFWNFLDNNDDSKLDKDEFKVLVTFTAMVGSQTFITAVDHDGDGLVEPKRLGKFLKALIQDNYDIMWGINEENLAQLYNSASENSDKAKNKLLRIDIAMFLISNWFCAFDPDSYTPIQRMQF